MISIRTIPTLLSLMEKKHTHMEQATRSISMATEKAMESDSIPQPQSGFRAALRLFKLQILGLFVLWRASNERPKIAIYQNRWMAALHALTHIPPLGAALALLIINCRNTFIINTPSNFVALQFCAKLHEILMQASITEILFSMIRIQSSRSHVSLGALLAQVYVPQISYLFSLEFWSTVTSRIFMTPQKTCLAILMRFLLILAAVVGPSSAVAMIPRPMESGPVKTSDGTAGPQTATFPSKVTRDYFKYINAEAILLYNNDPIASGLSREVQTFTIIDSHAVSRVLNRAFRVDRNGSESSTFITASVPTSLAAHAVWEDISAADFELAYFRLLHPSIKLACKSIVEWSTPEYLLQPVQYWSDDGKSLKNLYTMYELIKQVVSEHPSTVINSSSIPPLWYPMLEEGSSSTVVSLLAHQDIYEPPFNLTDVRENDPRLKALSSTTCAIHTYWTSSKHEATFTNGNAVVQLVAPPDGLDPFKMGTPFTLSKQWLDLLSGAVMKYRKLSSFSNHVSELNGLDNALFGTFLIRTLSDTITEDIVIDLLPEQTDPSMEITIDYVRRGYGYNASSVPVILSLTVLGLYSFVASSYIIFLITTGTTSTAWDSAAELLVLALNSRQPDGDRLKHTSVGVETMQTFKEPVSIRVNNNNELELVFANDGRVKNGTLRKLVRNVAY